MEGTSTGTGPEADPHVAEDEAPAVEEPGALLDAPLVPPLATLNDPELPVPEEDCAAGDDDDSRVPDELPLGRDEEPTPPEDEAPPEEEDDEDDEVPHRQRAGEEERSQ